MKRVPGTGWHITGAAVLTAWVLAACGLEVGSTAAAAQSGQVANVGQPTTSTPTDGAVPARRLAATIETGEITQIERIVVTPPSRVADGLVVYRVVVRLQNGGSREFTEPSLGELKVGDRVQVVNGVDPTT